MLDLLKYRLDTADILNRISLLVPRFGSRNHTIQYRILQVKVHRRRDWGILYAGLLGS